MAIFKNLTVKELYSSIPAKETISQFMRNGLEQNSTQLAVSAMEELLLRGDEKTVHENLAWAIEEGFLKLNTPMSSMISRSFLESHDVKMNTKVLVGYGLLGCNFDEMARIMGESINTRYGKIPNCGERTAAENLKNLYRKASLKWMSSPEEVAKAINIFVDIENKNKQKENTASDPFHQGKQVEVIAPGTFHNNTVID